MTVASSALSTALLLLAVTLVSRSTTAVGRVVQIWRGSELPAAFTDSSVTVIELLWDVVLREEDWATWQLPILLDRNVTIKRAGALAYKPAFDNNFVENVVQIRSGNELNIEDVVLVNFRKTRYIRAAPGVDMVAPSPLPPPGMPRPILRINGTGILYELCFSEAAQRAANGMYKPPPELPNADRLSEFLPSDASWCSNATNHLFEHCYPLRTYEVDWGMEAYFLDAVGASTPANVVLHLLGTTSLCQILVPDECLLSNPAITCFTTAYTTLGPLPPPLPEAPAGAGAGGGGDDGAPLGIILPCVLGGTALIAALLAVAALLWRRRRRGKGGFSPGAAPTASSSTGLAPSSSEATAPGGDGGAQKALSPPSPRNHAQGQGPAPNQEAATQSNSGPMHTVVSVPLTEHTPLRPHVRLDLRFGEDVVVDEGAMRGAGAFGRVLEGSYLGQRVAVKVLHLNAQHRAAPQLAINSLKQEAHVLSRCENPNVVRVLGACLAPPHLCLVMELMDQSLEQLMERHTKVLPMEQVLQIAMDTARGLSYLHPTVVHRDLKPANVLLDAAGTAKLSDFGLARLRETVCETQNPEAGTAPYMAPECFDPAINVITHKADMYSWAVMVWELLASSVPWAGLSPLVIAFAVTFECKRLPMHVLHPDRCPAKLRTLLAECWDADPLRRPAAEEVLKRLEMVRLGLERAAAGAAVPPGAAAAGGRGPTYLWAGEQPAAAAAPDLENSFDMAAAAGAGAMGAPPDSFLLAVPLSLPAAEQHLPHVLRAAPGLAPPDAACESNGATVSDAFQTVVSASTGREHEEQCVNPAA